MDAKSLLQGSVGIAHSMFTAVLEDCTPVLMHARHQNGTINSAGVVAAHAVMVEDMFVQGVAQAKPLLLEAGGVAAKLGTPAPTRPPESPEWTEGFILDLPVFREYMRTVFEATDAYLAGLSGSDLSREVDFVVGGKQPLGQLIGGLAVWHLSEHCGEIAALKGVQGAKGLPF